MSQGSRQEEHIKRSLNKQTIDIEPSGDLFNRIRVNIYEKEQSDSMKKNRLGLIRNKGIVRTVAMSLAVLSVTVVGATAGKSWVGSSKRVYKDFPTKQQILEDVGFTPKYTETLPGGFEYIDGAIGEGEIRDEQGTALATTKHIMLGYKNSSKNDLLSLTVRDMHEAFSQYQGEPEGDIVDQVGDIELNYVSQIFKFVPPDYEITKEDEEAMADGSLEISEGTSEISVEHYQSLSWYEDGLEYSIGAFDSNFEIDEMVDMAEYVINEGNQIK